MKAWMVREKDEFAATIVFAETAGKARALAGSTDACCNSDWRDIEVIRAPKADSLYKEGKLWLEWNDPHDRLFLTKEYAFSCEFPNEQEPCEDCITKNDCSAYQDMVKDYEVRGDELND